MAAIVYSGILSMGVATLFTFAILGTMWILCLLPRLLCLLCCCCRPAPKLKAESQSEKSSVMPAAHSACPYVQIDEFDVKTLVEEANEEFRAPVSSKQDAGLHEQTGWASMIPFWGPWVIAKSMGSTLTPTSVKNAFFRIQKGDEDEEGELVYEGVYFTVASGITIMTLAGFDFFVTRVAMNMYQGGSYVTGFILFIILLFALLVSLIMLARYLQDEADSVQLQPYRASAILKYLGFVALFAILVILVCTTPYVFWPLLKDPPPSSTARREVTFNASGHEYILDMISHNSHNGSLSVSPPVFVEHRCCHDPFTCTRIRNMISSDGGRLMVDGDLADVNGTCYGIICTDYDACHTLELKNLELNLELEGLLLPLSQAWNDFMTYVHSGNRVIAILFSAEFYHTLLPDYFSFRSLSNLLTAKGLWDYIVPTSSRSIYEFLLATLQLRLLGKVAEVLSCITITHQEYGRNYPPVQSVPRRRWLLGLL